MTLTLPTSSTTNSTSESTVSTLQQSYQAVRSMTESLCEPLAVEDYVIQSMTDASPTKWHLAHTAWFFEQFFLKEAIQGYQAFNPDYFYLFNSYYIGAGERFERSRRGMLSRPTVAEVFDYRHEIDRQVNLWLNQANENEIQRWKPVLVLGLNHEQQHQELLITDMKHMLSYNPLHPVYLHRKISIPESTFERQWVSLAEGIYEIGYKGSGFSYDNEGPLHRQYISPIRLASRLISNAEYLQFMEDDGYRNPSLWLSEGWNLSQLEKWAAPLYWEKQEGEWKQFTLQGFRSVVPEEPVTHISYFEADAFARWAGARLPAEYEWEAIAQSQHIEGNFLEDRKYHPAPLEKTETDRSIRQLFGDGWEWTQSSYSPYPGYKPSADTLGEYNGKWMCNQYVLRGGSCMTPSSHIRASYRNFFPAYARWQFSGIRLAQDE